MVNGEAWAEQAKQAVQEGFLTDEESKAWFHQMQETLYLLSSASNAQRLLASIEQIKVGEVKPRVLGNHDAASK